MNKHADYWGVTPDNTVARRSIIKRFAGKRYRADPERGRCGQPAPEKPGRKPLDPGTRKIGVAITGEEFKKIERVKLKTGLKTFSEALRWMIDSYLEIS